MVVITKSEPSNVKEMSLVSHDEDKKVNLEIQELITKADNLVEQLRDLVQEMKNSFEEEEDKLWEE